MIIEFYKTWRLNQLLIRLNKIINFEEYATLNPDIASGGMHPAHHFIRYGWCENRFVSKNLTANNLVTNDAKVSDALKTLNKSRYRAQIDSLFHRHNPPLSKNEVRFIGYVESKLGLGTAARGTVECFSYSSSRYSIFPYSYAALDRYDSKFQPEKYDTYRRHQINVFELGLDHIDHALNHVDCQTTSRSYNVLKLYWELSEIPSEKIEALNRYNEIWAPSKFVYDAVVKVYNKKVFIIPPYVDVTQKRKSKRSDFGLSDDKFYFLFSFDYNSSIQRKNPFAVLEAFRDAFPPSDSSIGFVIKTNNPSNASIDLQTVEKLKKIDSRVLFIEDYIDRDTMLSLIKCCNCYVSLHRSEGYGMGMAEAISVGRKVIATNYSGNIDFMNRYNSFPVDYDIVRIEADQYYLSEGKTWADPTHESAVRQLRAAVIKAKPSLLAAVEQKFFSMRSIPSKARLSRMILARIRAIKRENHLD